MTKKKLNEFLKFSINLNWIYMFDGGREDSEYKEMAKKYLIANKLFMRIEELCAKKNIPYEIPNGDWEKRKYFITLLSEKLPWYYINPYEDIVCDLSDNIDIPKESEFYFNYFFAYRLSNISITEIDAFLEYQLKINFNNECETFFRYITVLPREYSSKISNDAIKTIEEWINTKKNSTQQSISSSNETELQNVITGSEINSDKSNEENPFPRIFKNANSFKLFEALKEKVRDSNKLADYSFFYAHMKRDKLIDQHCGDTEFRNFLQDYYNVSIEKMKTLGYRDTQHKLDIYATIKTQFKPL